MSLQRNTFNINISNSDVLTPSSSFHGSGDCPCQLNGGCEELCCVEANKKVLRDSGRVQTVGQARGRTDREHREGSMVCFVKGESPEGGDDSSLSSGDSSQPLVPASHTTRSADLICHSPSDERQYLVREGSGVEESVRCGCHVKVVDNTTRKAVIKLVLAAVIAVLFMIGEVIGGYYSHSLAIMTDAAHMLSDFASFLISLFAIWVARRPPSSGMSFGWHRAEVIGAIVSVLIIWVLTGVLVYEAVLRVIHRNFTVDPKVMLITACAGVFVNVFMCMVLHQHSHGHGGHGHSHGGGGIFRRRRRHNSEEGDVADGEGPREQQQRRRRRKASGANINVQAAFIHVIGDLIQSIGVVIAGYIIYFTGWVLVDPICTFIFCILVLFSTVNVLKDALRVVMEGTPKHLDYEEVKNDLNAVEGVKQAHSLHIWSITLNRTALSAHLALQPDQNSDEVLSRANSMLREKHSITQSTLQVEGYQEAMSECGTCQEPERKSFLRSLIPSFKSYTSSASSQ